MNRVADGVDGHTKAPLSGPGDHLAPRRGVLRRQRLAVDAAAPGRTDFGDRLVMSPQPIRVDGGGDAPVSAPRRKSP